MAGEVCVFSLVNMSDQLAEELEHRSAPQNSINDWRDVRTGGDDNCSSPYGSKGSQNTVDELPELIGNFDENPDMWDDLTPTWDTKVEGIDYSNNSQNARGSNYLDLKVPHAFQITWNTESRLAVEILDRQRYIARRDITPYSIVGCPETENSSSSSSSSSATAAEGHWSIGGEDDVGVASISSSSQSRCDQVSCLVCIAQVSNSDLTTEILILPFQSAEWRGVKQFAEQITSSFRVRITAQDMSSLGISGKSCTDTFPEEELIKLCVLILDSDRLHLEIRRPRDDFIVAKSNSIQLNRDLNPFNNGGLVQWSGASTVGASTIGASTIKPSFPSIANSATTFEEDEEKIGTLMSILPQLSKEEASRTLQQSYGDIERAVERVLMSLDSNW